MASGPITSWQRDGETMTDFIFWGSKITADGDCSHEIKRLLLLGGKVMTNTEHIKKQKHYFANKGPSSQSYGFSSSHIWKWELDNKESWAPKNWCFWTVVLEKTLESPLDCSTPGFCVHHQLLEFAQTHVHRVGDAIQPSHPLSSPSPPAFNLSQNQGFFQWVNSSHQVAKVLEFQLQHQSFQGIFRTDFL